MSNRRAPSSIEVQHEIIHCMILWLDRQIFVKETGDHGLSCNRGFVGIATVHPRPNWWADGGKEVDHEHQASPEGIGQDRQVWRPHAGTVKSGLTPEAAGNGSGPSNNPVPTAARRSGARRSDLDIPIIMIKGCEKHHTVVDGHAHVVVSGPNSTEATRDFMYDTPSPARSAGRAMSEPCWRLTQALHLTPEETAVLRLVVTAPEDVPKPELAPMEAS